MLKKFISQALLAAVIAGGLGIAAAPPASAAGLECVYVLMEHNRPFRPLPDGGVQWRCYMNSNQGSSGAVQALQRAYNQCYNQWSGRPGIQVDGIYGSKTVEAVRVIQSRENLYPDGYYGPQTALRLLAKHSTKGCIRP